MSSKVRYRAHAKYNNQGLIKAVIWVARTGTPWRALPKAYAHGVTVYKMFIRWSKARVWQMIFNTLAINTDNE